MQAFRFALPLALLLPAALPSAQQPLLEEVSRQAPYLVHQRFVALGDVDGDGHVDAYFGAGGVPGSFVFAENGVDSDAVALNDGSGRLVALLGALPPSVKESVDAALRDFDGDGHVDVLHVAGPSVELLTGDGSGVFQPAAGAVPPLGLLSAPERLAAGDFDGDGLADVLITGSKEEVGNPSERMLFATGAGFVLQPLPHTEGRSTVAALADLDLDGDLDAYVGKQVHGVILRNDGSAFTPVDMPVAAAPGTTTAVAAGDLDGDGDADVMLSEEGTLVGSYVATYLGDGAVGFVGAQFVSVVMAASDLVLGDLDGDGDLDAAATAGDAPDGFFGCLLYFNAGGAFSAGVPLKGPGNWLLRSLDAADLDGDNDLDLVCAGSPDAQVFFGEGGSFVDVTAGQNAPWLSTTGEYRTGAWLDVHGDGGQDVLIVGSDVPQRLYLDDGFGRYAEAAPTPEPEIRSPTSAAGLDVNGDGFGDVLIGYQEFYVFELPTYLELRIGGGDGTFAPGPAGSLPVVGDQVFDLAPGDLDGDGDQDALLGLTGDYGFDFGYTPPAAQNALLLSDGPALGTFHDASSQLPLHLVRTQAVGLGDLDLDGDLDAAVGCGVMSATEADFLYLNDGTAHFALAPPGAFPSVLAVTRDLEVADFDADGAPDVVATGYGIGNGQLYMNDGSGAFTYHKAPLGFHPIHAVDLDLDGDADVVSKSKVFLADGGLLTQSPGALSHAVDWIEALSGDPDRDGDADLFFLGSPCRLFHGVKRQLLTLGVPQLDQPLVLEVRGPNQEPFALALALSTASLELPGLGTLMLDPSALFVAASGVIQGPTSAAQVTFPALTDPAFLGLTVYWQALVGSSPKLTNQHKTVALNL